MSVEARTLSRKTRTNVIETAQPRVLLRALLSIRREEEINFDRGDLFAPA